MRAEGEEKRSKGEVVEPRKWSSGQRQEAEITPVQHKEFK
jgi:hypothetical protein